MNIRAMALANMAAMAAVVGGGRNVIDGSDPLGAKAIEMLADSDVPMTKRRPAQTNAVDPEAVATVSPSRQVRRQRERLAAKGRTDAFYPVRMGRSKYMPHIGKKERSRASHGREGTE